MRSTERDSVSLVADAVARSDMRPNKNKITDSDTSVYLCAKVAFVMYCDPVLKEKYRKLCQTHKDIPVFMCDWWLDIMCDGADNWGVCLSIDANGVVQGALTYGLQKFGFWKVSYPPPMSPYNGIWFKHSNDTLEDVSIDRQRHITADLIGQLPKIPYIEMKLTTDCTDWIPFYRAGFRQSTRYTYQLRDISEIDTVWNGFRSSIRRKVKKSGTLTIRAGQDLYKLHAAYRANLNQKNVEWKFPFQKFEQIDAALVAQNKRIFFEVVDENGLVIGSKYLIVNSGTSYAILSFTTPEARKKGLGVALTWEAIKICAAQGVKVYDFEGSMLEGVEEYFRSFGGIQTPYHYLVKTQNKLVTLVAAWKNKI